MPTPSHPLWGLLNCGKPSQFCRSAVSCESPSSSPAIPWPPLPPGSSWVRSSVILLNCHAMSYFEHAVQRLIISQRQRVTRPQCGGGGKDPCSLGSPSPGARCSIHFSCLGYPRPTLHFTFGHSKVCLFSVHHGVLCFWIPCLSAPWKPGNAPLLKSVSPLPLRLD